MQPTTEKLDQIAYRVKALLEAYAALKLENEQLTDQNILLTDNLEQLKKEKQSLEFQLSEALVADKAKKDQNAERDRIYKELGLYIKEIDKCILMMGDI